MKIIGGDTVLSSCCKWLKTRLSAMRDNLWNKKIQHNNNNNNNLGKVDVVKLIISRVILNVYICTEQYNIINFKCKVNQGLWAPCNSSTTFK